MEKKIAILSGDGIGPEIMAEAVKVLDSIAKKYSHNFIYQEALVGGAAYDKVGHPLPKETLDICNNSDAILFGSVGGPKYDKLPAELTPERGALLPLRKKYNLFANIRPAVIFGPLAESASLKDEKLEGSLDILIIRELTGGIYFGKKESGENWASDEMRYTVDEIERIADVAANAAMARKKVLASVDKANVLETSKLWRKTMDSYIGKNYPEIKLEHYLVDNAAMQLATNPKQFDVIVTENMFGDILSDLTSAITGSIGMLPSASIGSSGFGLYEPVHGSAPDIAGMNLANPLAQILSAGLMLKYSFGMEKESLAVEKAVIEALERGYRTADIAKDKSKAIKTNEMGDIIRNIITDGGLN